MSNTITSPVKQFPGTVTLPNHLSMPQALAYEQALEDGSALFTTDDDGNVKRVTGVTQTQVDAVLVPVIEQVIQDQDIWEDSFPASPRAASAHLVAWLWGEIANTYIGEVPEE